ncbi:MAG: hypothetical protein ACJAW1_003229 [Glaciecola sp.]|jgi:hypothetical protein
MITIFWRMVFAYRRIALLKTTPKVQLSVFSTTNGRSHRMSNLFSIRRQASDEKTPLSTECVILVQQSLQS